MSLKDELLTKERYYTQQIEKYEKLREAVRLVLKEEGTTDNRQLGFIDKIPDNKIPDNKVSSGGKKGSGYIIKNFISQTQGNWFKVSDIMNYAVKMNFRNSESIKTLRSTISGRLAKMADEGNHKRILERREDNDNPKRTFLYRSLK